MPYSEKARQRAAERKKLRAESQARQKKLLQQVQEAEQQRAFEEELANDPELREKLAEDKARAIMSEHEQQTGTVSASRSNWYFRKRGGE